MYSSIKAQNIALSLTGLFVIYIIVAYSLPFSFFVKVDEYRALDVCIGDTTVSYYSEREPRWGIKGTTYAQIVRFDDQYQIETTIYRGSISNPISFGYEPDTSTAQYETTWFYLKDELYTWNTPGVYGAHEWLTIYPLPLLQVKKFNKASDAKFTVVNCNQ